MKLILLTILIAFKVHADEIVFIKHDNYKNYEVVENLLTQNNDLEAIQNLKRLLDTDKQNEIYILDKLSKLYSTNNLTDRFISFLNSKIKKAPFNAQLNLQLAKEYLIIEKPAVACEKAKHMLLHVNPKESFYSVLADCSLALGRSDEAITYLDKYLNNQSNPALYLKRAQIHLELNNLSLAKSDLDFYFLKAKPNEKAYLLQADLFTKQQLFERLPELYKRCLQALEFSSGCFLGYLQSTRNSNAVFKTEHFDKYPAVYQEQLAIVLEIGHHYQQIKHFELAEKMYLLAYNKNPDKIDAATALFELYNLQDQSQKAFDILSRFIISAHDSSLIQTAQNLQNSLFQKNKIATATNVATRFNPKPAVTSNIDKQLYLENKYTEILSRMKKIKQKSDAEYFLLGNIYYHLNSHGNAKLSWSKVNPLSDLYHKAIFNTIVVMRVESMTTAANKLFHSTHFPPEMDTQKQKLATLLNELSKRLPANEKKKADDMLKALLYLDWAS